ncbi:hypothetical protein [Limnoglobus roseus]|uniref:Uncharacterized protein n=1 Tax=Limnoglobus roseus TaxID=2598579 RepID=A0A5C1A806_9BACT|nr:hypothetical protein [Limnoglobus roseus]QEL14880.1 hypothetical protein PX52LOC_01780 [Limnoglobus roseus]
MSAEPLWTPQPAAAALVREQLDSFLEVNGFITHLRDRLLHETGTRLADWVARITRPASEKLARQLREVGYANPGAGALWRHAAGMFPDVELSAGGERRLFIRVESVADFVLAQGLARQVAIDGAPLAAVRQARVSSERNTELWVIERHGGADADPAAVLRHLEAFRLRNRDFEDEIDGFAHARHLIRAAIADLGVDRTCDLFFQAEREFWQMRNRAARVQKARQDALGMGWANHDHHTYRSGRENFAPMIAILEEMGFLCRERFYAGRDAGWGAQVLEQPNVGVVIFADVDLSPDEVTGDFAHELLPRRKELGTVGLWCALHGEAFLQAGMHHLECQFAFDAAREQLKPHGVDSMKPFTDFEYLRQAFTKGEVWPVAEARITKLVREGRITEPQAVKFRTDGALGSHLEILQRDDGYKGFNQTGINEIILKTDPRRAEVGHGH